MLYNHCEKIDSIESYDYFFLFRSWVPWVRHQEAFSNSQSKACNVFISHITEGSIGCEMFDTFFDLF